MTLESDLLYKRSLNYAAYLLSARPYPSWILKEKLKMRKVSEEIQETVLKRCEQLELLNDREWVSLMIEKYQRKGEGPFKIRQRLNLKKTPYELIDSLLDELYPVEKQLYIIDEERKKAKFKDILSFKQFFYKKGFSMDIIDQTLIKDQNML